MRRWNKKRVALGLSAVMLSAGSAMAQSAYQAGTYTGEAPGFGGTISVQVTVDDASILSVEVLAHKETEGIGTHALEALPGQIVEAQGLGIDAVAGCTVTSEALLMAAENALASAGADVSNLRGKKRESIATAEEKQVRTQVVIVGAGAAGLAAAIEAKDAELDVLLLEKMPFVGGASATCGGGLLASGTQVQQQAGVEDDVEWFFMDILKQGEFENDPKLAWLFASEAGEALNWVSERTGAVFTGPTERGGARVPRNLSAEGGGAGLIAAMEKAAQAAGVEILTGTRAQELTFVDGRVTGLRADCADGTVLDVQAQYVLLATGGYGNERALLPDSVEDVVFYGPVCLTGDGQKMAQAVGAQLVSMDKVAVKPNGLDMGKGTGRYTQPANNEMFKTAGGIFVSKDGVRVVNEQGSEAQIIAAMRAQSDHSVYTVMDKAAFDVFKAAGIARHLFSEADVDAWIAADGSVAPVFVQHTTLADAAKAAGIESAAFEDTVMRYNESVKAGEDTAFGRKDLFEIGEGPYTIVKQNLRFATTLGGVRCDDALRVLGEQGEAIEGLYAAGEVVGDVHGSDAASNLTWAITSGKAASETIAERIAEAL